MPLRTWREIVFRTFKETSSDSIGLLAAGVAFYGFLALFPLLAAAVLTYGLVADPAAVLRHMNALTTMLPADVARIVGDQLLSVVQTSGGKKGAGLIVALAIAFFGARNAAGAIMTALNIAFDEEEKRGLLKTNLIALAITTCTAIALVLAAIAVAILGYLEELIPSSSGLFLVVSKVLSYGLFALAAAIGAAALYRYAPSRDEPRGTWLSPGSLFFAVAWVILTLAFGFYIARFGNYGATYGSLSAVVVLLTWLYLSSYALLFGGELNSELESRTRELRPPGPGR